MFRKGLILTAKVLLTVVSLTILVVLFFYCQSNIYSFPTTKRFTGNTFYNPYQSVSDKTLKANFHAHTSAYGGLTDGNDELEEFKAFYKSRGIDSPGISNYFDITRTEPIHIYEHGINTSKIHKLAINPKEELYFDYAFYQSTSHKQDIVNRLREKDALVVIAHPNMREGHNEDDMAQMVGYHFTEIRSHHANAEKYWDAALKTGKLSWVMINDDSHGIKKQLPGRFYNVVFTNDKDELLKPMEKGMHYGIAQKVDTTDLIMNSLQMHNDKISFDFGKNAKQTKLIADGVVVDSVNAGIGEFVFPKYAGYVRLVVDSEHCNLYTNPITRQSDSNSFVSVSTIFPTLKPWSTFFTRTYFSLVFISLLGATVRMWVPYRIPLKNISFGRAKI